MGERWRDLGRGRVSLIAPAIVVGAAIVCLLLGYRWIGGGLAVGAALALVNALLLSRRIDAAAKLDVPGAMMVMQLGLVLTLTLVGVVTVVLVKISLAMAVASAAGFAATQMGVLVLFYVTRARSEAPAERGAS